MKNIKIIICTIVIIGLIIGAIICLIEGDTNQALLYLILAWCMMISNDIDRMRDELE